MGTRGEYYYSKINTINKYLKKAGSSVLFFFVNQRLNIYQVPINNKPHVYDQ